MRKRIAIPIALLGLAGPVLGASAAAQAAVSDAVIIALNSVKLDRDAQVAGDVVVNEAATEPTLEPGFELSIDRGVAIDGDVRADSVDIDRKATINGMLVCNDGDPGCAGLGLPIFQPLPVFRPAIPGDGSGADCAPEGDCWVSGSQALAPGRYRDIDIASGATLVLAEGGYDVASIQAGVGSTIRFDGAAQLRVAGGIDFGKSARVTAGAGLSGRDLLVYVGDDANFGKNADLAANFHVAGLFHLDKDSTLSGSVIAFDADFDKNANLELDSAFNLAPVADPLTVVTIGGTAAFDLTATDADWDTLTFTLVNGLDGALDGLPASSPANPVASVPVTYSGGADGVQDQFLFMVTDAHGASDTATVFINPSETCVDDGDCDPGFYCDTGAQPDPVCVPLPLDRLVAQDGFYETAADTAIEDLVLSAQAPETVGDLEFTILSPPPADEGSVSTPVPVSPRSATAIFTPASGFTGQTSFGFQACEVDNSGSCDQATVTVDVQVYTAPAPPVAIPQNVTLTQGGEIEINLAVPDSQEGPSNETGREGCGDGELDPGEQCDDGNLLNGDGCDDQCQDEGQ